MKILQIILLLTVLLFIVLIGALLMWGVRLAAVESDSMVPAMHKTDAVLVWPTKPENVKVGEVVSLTNPETRATVTHRLYSVTSSQELITKGDANERPDPPSRLENLKGKVVAVFPGLGSVLDQLHRPSTLFGFLYVPLLLVIIIEAHTVATAWRVPYRYPGYGI